MDERVGVTMHKLPFGALLAIDLGLHDFQAGFAIFKNRASSASRSGLASNPWLAGPPNGFINVKSGAIWADQTSNLCRRA